MEHRIPSLAVRSPGRTHGLVAGEMMHQSPNRTGGSWDERAVFLSHVVNMMMMVDRWGLACKAKRLKGAKLFVACPQQTRFIKNRRLLLGLFPSRFPERHSMRHTHLAGYLSIPSSEHICCRVHSRLYRETIKVFSECPKTRPCLNFPDLFSVFSIGNISEEVPGNTYSQVP
jgi:hypothetical protein